MGTITTALCNTFKHELLLGLHAFETDTFKIALIKANPTDNYGSATTNYSVGGYDNEGTTSFTTATTLTGGNNDEYTGGSGYSASGINLTNVTATLSGTTAYIDFDDPQWGSSATIDADGALIYNSSTKGSIAGRAVCVINFGSTQSSDNGTFTITIPTGAAGTAIIRIS